MHDSSSPPRRPASVLAYAHPDLKRSVCVAGWILQAAGVLLMLLAAAGTVVAGIEEMSRQHPMPMGDYLFGLFILGTLAAVGLGEFAVGRRVRQNHRRAIALAIGLLGSKGAGVIVILGFIAADIAGHGFKWWFHGPYLVLFALLLGASVWLVAMLIATRRQCPEAD